MNQEEKKEIAEDEIEIVEADEVELLNDKDKGFKNNKFLQKQFVQKIINSFKLTTHKIALIVFFLSLTVLISLLEIPTFFNDFLTIDFGTTILLLTVFVVGLPYGLLIAIISPWLHLIIPHTMPPNVIGEIAYMFSSISVLIVFFAFNSLVWFFINKNNKLQERLFSKNNKDQNWKIQLTVDIIISTITVIIISLLNVFYNWSFILDLYGAPDMKKLLWILFFPYNLFKFTLVFILFCILKKPLLTLKERFNL